MPARLLALALVLAVPAAAQPATAADRAAFLGRLNLQDDALTLRGVLFDALRQTEPDAPRADHGDRAERFAFFLVAHGVTVDQVVALIDAGVDVLHAIAADERPLEEQSLLADLVVRAEVIEMRPGDAPEDGFRGSALVRVLDTYKGVAPGDTLVVRQRERETPTFAGQTYLFLLSNRMYRFAVARRRADVPEADLGVRFSTYRQYPMADDTLLWSGYTADDTAWALANVRVVDEVLRGD
ncbi:hypothetical protein [Rubrivirga sp.]|uniref:hypothetical protein n=1 Tax=Rubrivirga sp. TaxID=1885344 RepID=UPI003B53029A